MAVISKELLKMSQQPWFPIVMRELGYEKVVHCKDCKHRTKDLTCELDSWDPFESSRNADDDDWSCGDGEPKPTIEAEPVDISKR